MLISAKEAMLLPLIIFGICNLKEILCDENDASARNKKHFSLFSVVTFGNEECTSETSFTGGQILGTCYTSTECSDKTGTKSGNCAAGFGVCCILVNSVLTSATISENRTYIQNPLYPNTETSGAGTTVTYTIAKMQSDICQIRLDFDYFVIAGPANTREDGIAATDGNCLDKWATTLSGGAVIPTLCGVMTGLHMYMDMGFVASDTAAIAISLAGTTVVAGDSGILAANVIRKWRVKTAQIPCWAPYRAPEGCNQYFMSSVGQIVSPNFGEKNKIGTRGDNLMNVGSDLMNQNLKMCIRREENHCCVLYQVCNQYGGIDLTNTATTGDAATGNAGLISEGWSFHTYIKNAGTGADILAAANNDVGLVDGGCSTDYVEIPASSTGMKFYGASVPVNTRYCGHRLGYIPAISAATKTTHAPIWSCSEPFEVTYRTDQMGDDGIQGIGAAANTFGDVLRGVCLDFRQEAC